MVGGGAPRRFGVLDLADQGLALLGEGRRCISERRAFGLGFLDARRERRDLRGGAFRSRPPAAAILGDLAEPPLGKLGLARERLRLGAHLAGLDAMTLALAAHGRKL